MANFVEGKMDEQQSRDLEKMDQQIQILILNNNGLLQWADAEPRLKGQFPTTKFDKLLKGCQIVSFISILMNRRFYWRFKAVVVSSADDTTTILNLQ
jgi:hypothetical protein